MDWENKYSSETDFAVEEQIKEPPQYRVIFYNDDFTPKDFVVQILVVVFHKTVTEATELMETVHQKGSALIGVYSWDIANTRVHITVSNARKNGFPLRCELEEE
jgi:ATP-dependent Clp protease adaptor protein ClpS